MNYLDDFPLSNSLIPARLKQLLTPVDVNNPKSHVPVAEHFEHDLSGDDRECLLFQMAAVQKEDISSISAADYQHGGVVSFSTPDVTVNGGISDFTPSISGHEYIVASQGGGSFFTFNLAEEVWMALGLTPRSIGGEHQKLIFDDLALPDLNIASGEVSNEYYWSPKRDVKWTMRKDYLRQYLWMRGAIGTSVFFYEKLLQDSRDIRTLMKGKTHYRDEIKGNWYELDLREHRGQILMQTWGVVQTVSSELSYLPDLEEIIWPDHTAPMARRQARDLAQSDIIYLNDKFLCKYEDNPKFDAIPYISDGRCHCSPSYGGQWGFENCLRVGRNLIRVPVYYLYKGVPDVEIFHARKFALSNSDIAQLDLEEEHIVAKVGRLLEQILVLGSNLSKLGDAAGLTRTSTDLVGFTESELSNNGWLNYPILVKLAKVAPLDMNSDAFLSRCKTLHEVLQKLPNNFLTSVLKFAGCTSAEVKGLGSFKLLQGLLNIFEDLSSSGKGLSSLAGAATTVDWKRSHPTMAPLFINNDLRIADAHEAVGSYIKSLEDIGFDIALVDDGYGKALDFVVDRAIGSIEEINFAISKL